MLRQSSKGALQGVTLIGGLAGHGKTLCMLAMARVLLEGGKVFTKFPATRLADRVFYLIPEAALGSFSAQLRTFRLAECIEHRLSIQALSSKEPVSLTDRSLPPQRRRVKTGDMACATKESPMKEMLEAAVHFDLLNAQS